MSFISIESKTDFKLQKDLLRLEELQILFGTRGKILSYDPAPERWRWEEMARNANSSESAENFIKYQIEELRTALKERYNVSECPVKYSLNPEGRVYNELLENEPFDEILLRGIAYRRENGSDEEERELCELEGYLSVCEKLFDEKTKVGTTMVVISPPGLVENSPYQMNFVDIYEKTDGKTLKMTRFSSGTGYEEYIEIAKKQNPDYFSGTKDVPIDAWFLSHPIETKTNKKETPKEIFEKLFEFSKSVTTREDFEKIYETCLPLILNFIDVLTQEDINTEEVRTAFKAIFNKGDTEKDNLKRKEKKKVPEFKSVQQEVIWFGKMQMRRIKSGCGTSADFGEKMETGTMVGSLISEFFLNSVGKFAEKKEDEDDHGELWFRCTKGHWNKRLPGKLLDECQRKGCTGSVGCGGNK